MKKLIIGAGNGGLAFGAMLIENNDRVNLYDKFKDILTPIIENGNKIECVNNHKKQTVTFDLVTTNLKDALENVDLIYIVTPAFAHAAIAEDLAKYIKDSQIIILHPGRTGGALEVKRILEKKGKKDVVVAEAETLLFACRKLDNTTVKIYGIKNNVGVATLPIEKKELIVSKLNETLPFFIGKLNVIETSLSNIGAIFHPAPFLFNLSRIESQENFKYYHDGITPMIATLLEGLDAERLEIAKAFDLNINSTLEWLNEKYGLDGKSLYEAIQMNTSYSEIYAPKETASRYVLEDVPMSLVPMKNIAKLGNIPTPVIDSLITIASHMYNKNFETQGRTLKKMGLNDKSLKTHNINNN